MADSFESQKNIKASGYTLMICVALLILFLFVKWTLPNIPPPPEEEGIEVNLGNSEQGLGDDQPFLPGKPSPADNQSYSPPKQINAPQEEAVKDFETDDNDEEAPVIKKPPVTKPQATKAPEKEVVKSTPTKTKPSEDPPAPAPPKPKAVFKGVNGTGTGGNEADSYKKGGNQGIAGGRGDQGAPGGNPDSDNYKGGGNGNSGVAIRSGLAGRRISRLPSFEDDFNENAKVSVDIRVDAAGNVISAEYQPRGSTTSDPALKAIALRKAKQVKFNASSEESSGTLQFNFRLKS
jgi:outer membrane biosynthesis protein TonB